MSPKPATQQPKRAAWPAALGAAVLLAFGALVSQTEDGGRFIAKPYRDSVGVLTACGGLTNSATVPIGHMIVEGATYTPALCKGLFDKIVQRFSNELRRCVRVPVAAREMFAYLHFGWNVGTPAFCRSTLARKLNAGDYAGACAQILVWTRAGGRDCRVRANNCYGIVIRRELEHAICTGKVSIPGLPDIPLGI